MLKTCEVYDLAASDWIATPGVGLASLTSQSFCQWWTDTFAGDGVTNMSWQSALRTFCSQTHTHTHQLH